MDDVHYLYIWTKVQDTKSYITGYSFFDSLQFPVANDRSFGVLDLGPLGGQERSIHDFAYIIVILLTR